MRHIPVNFKNNHKVELYHIHAKTVKTLRNTKITNTRTMSSIHTVKGSWKKHPN